MQQHVVDHPVGHLLDPVRDPDGAVGRACRSPSGRSGWCTQRTLAGTRRRARTRAGSGRSAGGPGPAARRRCAEPRSSRAASRASIRSTHSRLLGAGELGRDEHDDPLAVAVRGHRAAPALAAPHLDDRLARPRHHRPAQPRIPCHEGTLMRTDQGSARVNRTTRARKMVVDRQESEKILAERCDPSPSRHADGAIAARLHVGDHATDAVEGLDGRLTVRSACPAQTDLSDLFRHAHSRRRLAHSVDAQLTWNRPDLGRVREPAVT